MDETMSPVRSLTTATLLIAIGALVVEFAGIRSSPRTSPPRRVRWW